MLSFRPVLLRGGSSLSLFAALSLLACASPPEDDDDDGAFQGGSGATSGSGNSAAGNVGGTTGAGGGNTGSATSSATGSSGNSTTSGSGAASGSDSSASGNTSSSNTGGIVYDGGTRPLTEEEAEELYGDACAGWASEGEAIPSVLQLVVDVSASMGLQAPGTNQTKWEVTRSALLDAIVGNGPGTGLPGSVAVGMLLYPNTPDDTPSSPGEKDINLCVNTDAMIPIAPLGTADDPHRALIRDTLNDVQLRYGTPTHDAYSYAANFGLLPAEAPGERFMVLITDGAPTVSKGCQNEQPNWADVDPWPIVDSVDAAYQLGIRTFFIGAPGSDDSSLSLMRDNRIWMSLAAFVGDTAFDGCQLEGPAFCHMDMTQATNFSTALRNGLGAIAGQVSPCTYTFAEPPAGRTIDEDEINIVIEYEDERTLVVRDDVGDCSDGWRLTDNNEILLCPTTCNTVQLDPNITVRVTFGCESYTGPIG